MKFRRNRRYRSGEVPLSGKISRSLWIRFLIGGATVLLSTTAYWSYQTVRTLILNNIKENALLEVQQGVNEIDQWLIDRKVEIETIANTTTLQTMDWQRVEPYLQSELARSDDFFIFAMVEPDGSFYNTQVGQSTKNASHRHYFQQAMAGHTTVSDPFIGLETGIPTLAIAAPIWPSLQAMGKTAKAPHQPSTPSSPIGDVNGNIRLDRVTEVVSQLNYGNGSYAFALNSQGGAITHPDTSLLFNVDQATSPIWLDHANTELANIAQHMVKREQDISLQPIDGELQYVAYLPLQQANWSVALVIPRRNIETQVLLLDFIALAVAGLTLAMVALLWSVQSFEQRQLKKTKDIAEAANQAKSDFLANMSHELRTPLNSILGYAQILRRENNVTPKQQKGLNIIHQSGEHLLMLINDVLDIAQIEARQIDIQPHVTHLPTLLIGIVEITRIRADQKGLEFHYHSDENLPQTVVVDEKRLRQVLINLLGNAVKFTEQGSITFSVSAAELSTSQLTFEVTDTGIGIADSVQVKIFDPFEQVHDSRNKREGTGLGLAISQQIVSLMDSHIHLHSQLGNGSTFSFTLDLAVPSRELGYSTPIAAPAIVGYEGDRKSILVVDDHWKNRSVLVNLLEPLGFTLLEAEDGQAGLIKALINVPDLVITDLVMPELDGYGLLQQLRQSNDCKNIPVVVSSASVSASDRHASLKAGADDFLPKPLSAHQLFAILAKHLNVDWEYAKASEPTEKHADEHLRLINSAASPVDNPKHKEHSTIIVPPPDEMRILHHAAEMGNILEIEQEAHRLTTLNKAYQPFATKLLQLAQSMDDEAILSMVEKSFLSVR